MEVKVHLSENQISKIQTAYRKKVPVTIQLGSNQLNGNNKLKVTERQSKKIQKSKNENKGCRLTLSFDQLKQNHSGGFLPLVFAGLAALGSLVGGGAAIAKTINENKNQQKELEELKRHNLAMEQKSGSGLKKKTKKSNR